MGFDAANMGDAEHSQTQVRPAPMNGVRTDGN
jgi:hypothetical protein